MQSKQRLQVPTDDSGGQLETLWQAQELFEHEREEDEVAPATFQSNADGPFYDCFFFLYTDTQKVKLVTLFDRHSVPQDDKDDAHTGSHIGIGNQNVANSTTALKWIGGYCEGWEGWE